MHRLRLHKPSPAFAVAILALMVALGGTAVAKFGPFKGDKIIKKSSLSGNRLKNNSVNGKKLKLSTVGKVPSAANADTVGGVAVKKFGRTLPAGTGATPLASVAGVTINGACSAGGTATIAATKDAGAPTTAFNFTSSSTGANNNTFTNGSSVFTTFNLTNPTPNTVGEYVSFSSAGTSTANYMSRDGSPCTFAGNVSGG